LVADVVVVGAGPYGLSIAAHLRAAGVGVRVFGDRMASWRKHMPAGMYLKSTPDASSLSAPQPGSTIFDYCSEIGSEALTKEDAIPIDLFIDYGMWFADRHVPDVEPERVVGLSRAGSEFYVELDSGETVRTDAVVVACGVIPYAYTPPELLGLAPNGPTRDGVLSHTAQHVDLTSFAGQRVAVVGAGQSALENAALLAESGADVHVLARSPRILWGTVPDPEPATRMHRLVKPPSALGEGWSARSLSGAPGMVRYLPARARLALVKSVLGPSGAWWLRDRVEGKVDIRAGVTVTAAVARGDERGARLSLASRDGNGSGGTLDVDHVMAATGYRVGLDALGFLEPELKSSLRCVAGSPLLNASFESSVPGLYFSGLTAAATFGPLLRFVHGAAFAATRIGSAVPNRRRRVAV
jgi:lysine/ornithine N-monooxygenase